MHCPVQLDVTISKGYLTSCTDVHVATGDEEDWREWKQKGDPITHIELRKWADCMLLAPLSANTLAKLAHVRQACMPPAIDPLAEVCLMHKAFAPQKPCMPCSPTTVSICNTSLRHGWSCRACATTS